MESTKLVVNDILFPNLKKQEPNVVTIKYSVVSHKTSIFFDKKCFWCGTEISIPAKTSFHCNVTYGDYSCYEELCEFFKNHKAFCTINVGLCSSEFSRII